MKNLLLLMLGSLLCSLVSAKTFTFLFTEGKEARWSVLSNWSNNEYPQNLTDADLVMITAPTNTPGWICRMDTNFSTVGGNFRVGPNVQFWVEKDKVFEYSATTCLQSGSFKAAAGSEIVVYGYFILKGRYLISSGPVTIYGVLSFQEWGLNYDCSQGIGVIGLVKVYGAFGGTATSLFAKELWVMKTGYVGLGQGWNSPSDLATERLINEGEIYTRGSGGNRIDAWYVLNKGTIELLEESIFTVSDFLENRKNIRLSGEVNLNGTLINNGRLYATSYLAEYGNYNHFSFNGSINNKGWMHLAYENFSMNGQITNDSVFIIRNGESQYKVVDWNMSGINNNTFYAVATLHFQQPFVNNNNFYFFTPIDSSRVNNAFINTGKLACFGEVVFGAGFINSGQMEFDEWHDPNPFPM